tara:strand:- start:9921 stop:10874 length:954 start_codon:yes stop_codon:yes gene_type:complete
MSHTLKDLNRRNPTLRTSKVNEILPEYFQEDNSKLISLLKEYYKYLDSDQAQGFGYKIQDLIYARDGDQTSVSNLDELIKEIGNGLQASSFFEKPRLMAKLLGEFYRTKGSRNSAEGFFRGFFNEEAEITYPKDQLFIVGESQVGYESQKFIQNNGIYQTFSILIKCGISTVDYENLYKRFVHPAGFHFAGQVLAVNEGIISLAGVGTDPLAVDSALPTYLNEASITTMSAPFSDLTGILDSSDGTGVRVRTDQLISVYSSLTATQLNNYYFSVEEIIQSNSYTFDDSTPTARPDFSLTLETMDNEIFTRYTSDSAH